MSNDLFDEIRKSTARVRNRRMEMLDRYQVGDMVYPVYQVCQPNVFGVVSRIDRHIRKVFVDLNGCVRQYDPEDLIRTNPELKERVLSREEQERTDDIVEQAVSTAFDGAKVAANARAVLRMLESRKNAAK